MFRFSAPNTRHVQRSNKHFLSKPSKKNSREHTQQHLFMSLNVYGLLRKRPSENSLAQEEKSRMDSRNRAQNNEQDYPYKLEDCKDAVQKYRNAHSSENWVEKPIKQRKQLSAHPLHCCVCKGSQETYLNTEGGICRACAHRRCPECLALTRGREERTEDGADQNKHRLTESFSMA